MMTFPEIRLGKARPHTDRVKARAGARRRRMTSHLEVLEDRTLLSFTPIATPTPAYVAATTLIPIPTPDGTVVSSITSTDGLETVSISPSMTTHQTLSLEWNFPPAVETATPNTLETTGGPITLSLSNPAVEFGVEMQWTPFDPAATPTTITMTASFYDGASLVGSIPLAITQPTINDLIGNYGGALLFAAQTNQAFTSVVLSNPSTDTPGIEIAQVRYQLATPQLTGTAGNEITGVEGSSTGTVQLGTFYDGNQAATAANYTTPPGSVVVNWGDGSAPQTLAAGNLTAIGTPNGVTWTINAAHTYTEEGTYAYTVTVTDVGGEATTVDGSAIIADATLTAGPATLLAPNTGIALPSSTVVATFTDANTFATTADYTATIAWGDGSPNSTGVVVATATPGVFDVEGPHTYAKPGVFTTHVTVRDDGGETVVVPGTATVTDQAVTGATKNFTATEGKDTGLFVLATFTDPNTLATVANENAVLAVGGWGDGTPGVAGITLVVQQIGVTPLTSATNPGAPIFEVLGSHTYAEETPAGLPDTLSVIVTTLGGTSTTLTSPPGGGVTVLDAALTSSNGTTITGTEGMLTPATTLIGTFTDTNQGATSADFLPLPGGNGGSIVVNWGDGTAPVTLTAANITATGTPNGVVFTLTAGHDYVEEGTYPITIKATDDGGATTIISSTAIISAGTLAPLAPGLQPVVSTTEAALFPVPVFAPPVFNGPVAAFTDSDPLATISDYQTLIDWGDGTPMTAGTVSQPGGVGTAFVVSGSHTYADSGVNSATNGGLPGTYVIQVFVVDQDGARLTISNPNVTVADNPIVLTGKLNPASDSGKFHNDGITNVNQPNFFGKSEPLSTVTLSATASDGTITQIGSVEAGSNGSWSITSDLLADGSYTITASAVDQFGITTTTDQPITTNVGGGNTLVIDTVGPRITNAQFSRLNETIFFTFQDFPQSATSGESGLLLQSLSDAANYSLNRVLARPAGTFIVTSISATPGATPDLPVDVTVVFNNGHSIRGGFFSIIARAESVLLHSGIQDLAGNAWTASFYGTASATGNGVRGGDFVANFKDIHQGTFGFGYSGPVTIIGYPHPNDPPSKFPKSTPVKKTKPVVVKHPAAHPVKVKVAAPAKHKLTAAAAAKTKK